MESDQYGKDGGSREPGFVIDALVLQYADGPTNTGYQPRPFVSKVLQVQAMVACLGRCAVLAHRRATQYQVLRRLIVLDLRNLFAEIADQLVQ